MRRINMKRKIALILVLALSLSLILASCGKNECKEHVDEDKNSICDKCKAEVPYVPQYLGFEGYYNTNYEENAAEALSAAVKANDLTDMERYQYQTGYNLVAYSNNWAEAGEKKYAVINTDTGAIVYSLIKENTVASENVEPAKIIKTATITYVNGYAFILETAVDSTDEFSKTYTYTLYTALGAKVASVTSKQSSSEYPQWLTNNLFKFDGKVYEMDEDVVTYRFDAGFKNIPYCDYTTEKYNYRINYENYSIYVYDKEYNYITSYVNREEIIDFNAFVLNDGNLFIQYSKALMEDAVEYDFMQTAYDRYSDSYSMNKYALYTEIYNVETKTATAIDCDYIVNEIFNEYMDKEAFTEVFVSGKLDNVAFIHKIENKEIISKTIYADIRSTDLQILGYLGNEIADQSGLASLIADNRFVVYNESGKKYLINEKAELIGEVTGANWDNNLMMFINGRKAYDTDLKVAIDMSTVDYVYEDGNEYYVIMRDEYQITNEDLSKETKRDYYILNSETMKFAKLGLTEDEVDTLMLYEKYFSYNLSVVENEGTENERTKYFTVYCNINGTEIFRLQTSTETTTNSETNVTTSVNKYVSSVLTYGDSVVFNISIATSVTGQSTEYSNEYYISSMK
jgi:hypothetical protein